MLQGVMPFTGVWSTYHELYPQRNKQTKVPDYLQKLSIVKRSSDRCGGSWASSYSVRMLIFLMRSVHVFNGPVMYKRHCSANLLSVLRLLQSSNSVFLVRLCRSMHMLTFTRELRKILLHYIVIMNFNQIWKNKQQRKCFVYSCIIWEHVLKHWEDWYRRICRSSKSAWAVHWFAI